MFQAPARPLSVRLAMTGRHVMRARVRTARDIGFGRLVTSRTPVVEASLPFTVLSDDDLSRRGLTTLLAQGPPATYARTMRELDQQIADIQETQRYGSPAMEQLTGRREALSQMRQRMVDELGAAPAAPPDAAPLDTSRSYVFPLPAVMAVTQAHGVVPLQIFVRLDHVGGQWRGRVVDATTRDVVHFEGTAAGEVDAARSAIAAWRDGNEYPQGGTVRYEATVLGATVAGSFSTSSTRKDFWEWFDRILFIGQILLGTLALLAPEPTGASKAAALALFLRAAGTALLVVGILRGMHRIYESRSLGRPDLDERHILEALGILSAALGVGGGSAMTRAAGTALRGEALSARALTQFQLGRGVALTGVALDAGTFVWVAHSAFAQMQAAASDPSVPESERAAQLQSMMLELAAQGLLIVGTNAHLFGRGAPRGTRAPFIERLGELRIDPVMRTRMETVLRRHGDTGDLSALTPRQLLDRYIDLQRARAQVEADVTERAAVRGQGVYDPAQPDAATGRGPQSAATVEHAARPFTRTSPVEHTRLEGVRVDGDVVRATLVVEVPATATRPADTLTVAVTIEVPAQVRPGAAHGDESGMANMAIGGDEVSGWALHIELDSRLAGEADVRHHLAHELREGSDIIRRATQDPSVRVEDEMRARVFGSGAASGQPSAHDRAAALELRDIFGEMQRSLDTYNAAREAAERTRGAMPARVRDAGEAAHRRLDAMLDAMGFADPAHREAKRTALFGILGVDAGSPLARYIEGYAQRAQARVVRNAELARLTPEVRGALPDDLTPPLFEHVRRAFPVAAAPGQPSPIELLARLLGRNDPANNAVQRFARSLVQRHRDGQIADAALVDLLTRIDAVPARLDQIRAHLDEAGRGQLDDLIARHPSPDALERALQQRFGDRTAEEAAQQLNRAGASRLAPRAAPAGPSPAVLNALNHLESTGFADRVPRVREDIAANRADAIRGKIAVELARTQIQTRFPASGGYEIQFGLQVAVQRLRPDGTPYRTMAEYLAENSRATRHSGFDWDGSVWRDAGDMDMAVVRRASGGRYEFVHVEEIKSGARDQPTEAADEQAEMLRLARTAGSGQVRLVRRNPLRDVSAEYDLTSLDRLTPADRPTRGPAGRGFDQHLPLSADELAQVTDLFIERQRAASRGGTP
ncbi:MAG TPA: hypothetical protein VL242_36655 [Sorangium sp.]|nr:hypothetical protein [Sorangium sp.]